MITRALDERPRRSGFTLAELMVVIVIMGMIAGVAMVSWQALLPKQALNTAVRTLSDVLYGTRTEAIARSREFRVYYDIDNDKYWVETPYRADGTGIATAEDEPRRIVSETSLKKQGIDILSVTIDDKVYTDGTVFVRFDPLGSSVHHTVVLEHTIFQNVYTLEVLALTGDIRFHKGHWKPEVVDQADFD